MAGPTDWMAKAACREAPEPSIFFPGPGMVAADAIAYCVRCPVSDECYAYAIDDLDLQGIWSGTTERERRRIRRQRLRVTW